MQIADVYAKLTLDDKAVEQTLKTDLPREAGESGETSGKSFGSKFGSVAKGLMGGLVGAGIGAAFGVAAKGAGELDTAVRALQASTGMTAEEADTAGKALTGMYQNNLQGFSEIGKVMENVHNDLGLTGDAADKATAAFLRYATATGQEASGAVSAFDDILDSWGLTAADATKVMDLLIASHQKYGGSIADSQAALSAMAPAMTAAGMSVEEGAGLLNMFAASGIDASTASTAMTKALGKVKSPEELRTLLANISAVEDPFERAQLAADLFGVKAGAKMAVALGQGGLDTFMLSLDETAGATDRAADAIESGFGAQMQLKIKEFGGALAGIGSNFGPLLIGMTALLPMATPIFTTIGGALGAVLTTGIVGGVTLLPVLLVAAVVAALAFLIANPEILAQVAEIAGNIIAGIADFLGGLGETLLAAFGAAWDAVVAAAPGFLESLAILILTLPGRILGLLETFLGAFDQIFAAVVAAAPGFLLDLGNLILSLPGKIIGLLTEIPALFEKAWDAVIEYGPTFLTNLAQIVLLLPDRIVGLMASVLKVFVDTFLGVLAKAPGFIADVVAFILSIPGKIFGLQAKVVDFFAGIIKTVVAAIGTFVADVVREMLTWPGKIVGLVTSIPDQFAGIARTVKTGIETLVGDVVSFFLSIPGKIVSVGGAIVRGLIDGLASFPGELLRVIGDAFRNLRIDIGPFHISASGVTIDLPTINLPSLAVGTEYVPENMLAFLHRGEMVVPAHQAAALRAGGGRTPLPEGPSLAGGGGGFTMGNVVINAQTFAGTEGDARAFARSMFDRIEDEASRRGFTLGVAAR